jgi:hypothetical protein
MHRQHDRRALKSTWGTEGNLDLNYAGLRAFPSKKISPPCFIFLGSSFVLNAPLATILPNVSTPSTSCPIRKRHFYSNPSSLLIWGAARSTSQWTCTATGLSPWHTHGNIIVLSGSGSWGGSVLHADSTLRQGVSKIKYFKQQYIRRNCSLIRESGSEYTTWRAFAMAKFYTNQIKSERNSIRIEPFRIKHLSLRLV